MEDKNRSVTSGLMGTKDTGERVVKSIYKVKRADNTNTYDRVHFETQSKMICDATNLAIGDMVARRDSNGDIFFRNITANGTLLVKGNTDLNSILRVGGATTLSSALTVAGVTTLNENLVANKDASIAKNLSVAGTADITGDTRIQSTLGVVGNITTESAYFLPNCSISKSGALINFAVSGTGVTGFNFNKNVNVVEGATIGLGLTVGGAIQGNSTITANSNVITKAGFVLPGAEIKKDTVTNAILFNSTADSSGVSFNKTLSVEGAGVFKTTLSVAGTSNLTGKVSAKNDLEVLKNFSATGNATVGGSSTTNGLSITNTGFQLPGGKIEKSGNSIAFSVLSGATINDFYFTRPIRMEANSGVSVNLNADKVDGCDVNDTASTTSNLWTAKKVDDTKANKITRINAGEGLTGGGTLGASMTITHALPATVAKTFTTKKTEVIKSVEFDKFGHAAKVSTIDMEGVFATPGQVADLIANAGETSKTQFVAHTILNPDGSVQGPAKNSVNNLNMKNYSIDYNATSQCIQFTFA